NNATNNRTTPRSPFAARTKHIDTVTTLQPTTSLDKNAFAIGLHDHPDKQFTASVLLDISRGADLGFTGTNHARETKNAKSAYSNPQIITEAILKEIKAGYTVGPFIQPPFPNFVVNSLGLRPKKNGGHRIIMDSVNSNICKDEFSLHYSTVDDAVAIINKPCCATLLAKIDIQHSFRLCPVRREDWHLLGYKWDNYYFFDRVLPFGLR
ncbi:uncharacterized protein LOC144342493, partial [Saccoglossus kowalevskii]